MLIGNVGRDPEIRSLSNGTQIATFSLATTESWRDRNTGERKERTEWHNIIIRSEGLIKVVQAYVTKGSKLFVQGKVQTRKWTDQTGKDRFTTEIVLSGFDAKMQMLDGPGRSQSSERSGTRPPSRQNGATAGDLPAEYQANDLDDVPF